MDTMTINIKPTTPEERASWPKTIIVPLEKPFVDERGAIQPLVDVAMESCVLISSRKGTVRANHYHRTDWHYIYILSGSCDYYFRPTGSNQKLECIRCVAGDLIFTPPMEDHATWFLEDTAFLALSRNPRDQASYEADVVRIPLVDDKGNVLV